MNDPFQEQDRHKSCKSAIFGQQQQLDITLNQSKDYRALHLSQSQKLFNQSDSMHQSFVVKDAQSQIERSSSSIKAGNMDIIKEERKKGKFEELVFQIKLKFFARRLLNQTRPRMFKNLSNRQFKLIEDVSCDDNLIINRQKEDYNNKYKSLQTFGGKSKSSSFIGKKLQNSNSQFTVTKKLFKCLLGVQCLSQCLQQFDKIIPVLDPSSIVKVLWDLLLIILFSGYYFLIPLYMTFTSFKNDSFFDKLIISVPIFVVIDFLIKINTGFYEKGKMITKRVTILKRYLKQYFMEDFFIILCYLIYHQYLILGINYSRYADILLLSLIWKVNPFLQTLNKLEEYSFFTKKQKNIIALFKLIFTLMIIAHILSCLWIALADLLVQQGKKTWLKNNSFAETSWHQIYIDAYYFTTVTMITVGFGDIIPISEEEKTVCIMFMLFSCGIFAYSMNTVGSILQNFNEDQVLLSQNMSIINSYMKRKNVSKTTQNAIREYLEYYWKEENDRNQEQEDKIVNVLSENLRENLLLEGKGVVLKQSAIFRDNFSDTVKQKMIPLIKEYRYTPEEIICTQGETDDCSIYFIEKGSVNILIENDQSHEFISSNLFIFHYYLTIAQKIVSTITSGQSFGEISFFTGNPRTATIKSKEFTTIQLIKRQDFINLIYNLSEDYEQFCNIKDNISFYQDFQLIDVKCLSCQSLNHHVLKCPYLHFIPNYAKLREQYISHPFQERKTITRKIKKRKQSLNLIKENFYFANKMQELDSDLQDYIDAFLEQEDSSEGFNRSDEDLQSIGEVFRQNNDGMTQQNAIYSQLNNLEELQKRESSVHQPSRYTSNNYQQMVMADVNSKQVHADVSPSRNSEEIEQHGNPLHINQPNTQINKAKTKHMSYIYKDEDESQLTMQKSKIGTSSYKIESSLGENRRSLVAETFVQPNGKQIYEELFQNEGMDKNQQAQIYMPMTVSQMAIPRPRNSQTKITKTIELYSTALQKYQHFYNKVLSVIMESMPGNQQQFHEQQSPSIKQHVSSTQILSNATTDHYQKLINNNNRKVEKKSSFLNRNQSSMNNSKLPSSRNLLMVKQASDRQKEEIGNRRVSKMGDLPLQLMTKETNYLTDATNNVHYEQSIKEQEKDFYEEFIFDVQKNFTCYFPLNNLTHQIKLMNLNEEQRRRKMLRNHIENINIVRKNKTMTTLNRKGKRKSSVNSSQNMSKVQGKLLNHEDLEESQYTKKRSKFYQSQTNRLEGSSVFIGESSKRFDKLESQSQYQGKKQPQFNINSLTFNNNNNNQIDLTNKSLKSQHLKILQQETSFDGSELRNSINQGSQIKKKLTLIKKGNGTLDEDQGILNMFKKSETKSRDIESDTVSNSMHMQQEADNSLLKIMNASQEDVIKTDAQKNYTEKMQSHIKHFDSLKKVGSGRHEEQSQGCHSRKGLGDYDSDVQTEFSQNRRHININQIQIGLKNKNKL